MGLGHDSKSLAVRMVSHFTGQRNNIVVPVLFIRLLGSYEAAAFLSQCMYWQERTARADGSFYKSNEDWKEELELSPHQIRRVTRDCSALVDTWRGGENGVNNYRVNLAAVAEAIEKLLNSQALEAKGKKADKHGGQKGDVKKLDNRMSNIWTTGCKETEHPTIYTETTAESTAEEARRQGERKSAAAAFLSVEEKRKSDARQEKENRTGQGKKLSSSLDNVTSNAGNSNETSLENVPGAGGARVALEKCFAKSGFLDELLTEYDDRAFWLELPAGLIFDLLGKMRSKHGRKYATPLIESLDNAARQFKPAVQAVSQKKAEKDAFEAEIENLIGA